MGRAWLVGVLLAVATLHLRDSHFFTTDIAMTFLTVVAWWFILRVADGKGVVQQRGGHHAPVLRHAQASPGLPGGEQRAEHGEERRDDGGAS